MLLPRQVIRFNQLVKQGFSSKEITRMSASLLLFPTPFKGIYYIPSKEERGGWFIEKPLSILTKSIAAFLKSNSFYYSCKTAEEFWGISWHPSGQVHVVNEILSDRMNLEKRIERSEKKSTFRAKKIAKLLSLYGSLIIFHKVKSIADAKLKHTPYGTFAMKGQLKKDKKRFRDK